MQLRDGQLREAELTARLAGGPYPARNPQQTIADLRAQIAANQKGVEELLAMVAQFGRATVAAYMRHVQDNAEESVRRVITALKDGQYTLALDNGAQISVKVSVHAAERAANVAAALSGAYPVHGGLSRSVINFAAGAQTPLASLITAAFMAVIIYFFTGLFYYLPLAVLAFGADALAPAVVLFTLSNLLQFSFGTWLLDHHARLATAWRSPSVLAAFAGLAVGVAGVEPQTETNWRLADKYKVPTVKVTGGQRIDLLGVKKADLPALRDEVAE